MPVLPRLSVLLASLALCGCGGSVALDDKVGEPSPNPTTAPSSTQILLASFDASPLPAACIGCAVNADCGPAGAACVKAEHGSGFCAPGCNKEGFCTPDRVCEWVTDPAGQAWRACVPLVRDRCAIPDVPLARVRDAHPGTW